MMSKVDTVCWTASLLICVYLYLKWSAYNKTQAVAIKNGCQRPPKYPHRDPVLGYDLYRERSKATESGQLMRLYERHFEIYGKTFEEQFFNQRTINTMEAANIQQVAALGFQDWGKVPSRINLASPFFGRGIFSEDGAYWKYSSKLVKPTFSRSEISDIDSLDTFVERMIHLIPHDGNTIDIQPLLHKLFLDTSSYFLFGSSADSLLPDVPYDTLEFIKAFNESLAGVGRRRRVGMLRFIYLFDKSWKVAYGKVHRFIDSHVKRALDQTAKESSLAVRKLSETDENAERQHYILLREMAKEIRDPVELRYQILQVFLPARDTTSIAVGNALFHLARNPSVWQELRHTLLTLGVQPLTFELLRSLVLFRHVIQETLRLQGPSGRVFRSAVKDTILPVGGGPDGKSPIFVKKGVVVALNVWCLHHDRDIWGDDVHKFNPYRWIDKRPTWDFVPFFGGPRMCPAQQQVLTQAVYVLVRLVKEFARIENRDPVGEYVEFTKMATESRNGVKIALFPA